MALTDRIPYQAQIDRPKLRLPEGKKLAVWVILNVEEWRIENAMPRTVLSPPMGQPLLPAMTYYRSLLKYAKGWVIYQRQFRFIQI